MREGGREREVNKKKATVHGSFTSTVKQQRGENMQQSGRLKQSQKGSFDLIGFGGKKETSCQKGGPTVLGRFRDWVSLMTASNGLA